MRVYTERVLKLPNEVFKRTVGVKPSTYRKMRGVLEEREGEKKKSGRAAALDLDDQLVLSLGFWREYRTHHHLSLEWEVDESTVRRTIERVENALVRSGQFSLPGRKVLKEGSGMEIAVVVVDLAEQPIERPKKSSVGITAGRSDGTHKKARL
jgi:hypothetical protein